MQRVRRGRGSCNRWRCSRQRGGCSERSQRRGGRGGRRFRGAGAGSTAHRPVGPAQFRQVNAVQRPHRRAAARGQLARQDGGAQDGHLPARRARLRGGGPARFLRAVGDVAGRGGDARLPRAGRPRRGAGAGRRLPAGAQPVHAGRLRRHLLPGRAGAEPRGRGRGAGQAHRRGGHRAAAGRARGAARGRRPHALRRALPGAGAHVR